MKKRLKYLGAMIILAVFAIFALRSGGDIGVLRANIERDARASQKKISDDWQVAKQTTDLMSAMIFYSSDLRNNTFSIYINRPGISIGYFFRAGGSPIETDGYTSEYHIEGCEECAFISNNKQRVNKVEIDDGKRIKSINIDSEKPFALILPVNAGSVTIYDIKGTILKSIPCDF